MRKNLLTILFLFFLAATMTAGPARRGVWKTVRLADGSEARAELRGDEYGHFWIAEDGRAFTSAGGGLYKETSIEGIAETAAVKRAELAEAKEGSVSSRRRTALGGDHDPYTGKKKCLVVLVNFADTKFEAAHDYDYYYRMANEENFTDEAGNTQSVRDYFLAQSYGSLDIEFDVAGPVQLEHNYAYYGGAMTYVYRMIVEACEGAEAAGIDFSQYDWDGDGEVEQVYVVFAGHSADSYDDEDLIWSHMGYLSQYRTYPSYDGVTVNTYACSGELAGSGAADGIVSMCHEFSHCMGLPDAYDTAYGGNYGMSYWSVMDYGCYNGNNAGYLPAGYTSYERMYCGWLTPTELAEETEVSGMKGLTEGGEAYIIYNGAHPDEYYMLENRTPYGFDAGLFGSGLLIVHIDYNSFYWQYNRVNTTGSTAYGNTHTRYAVIPADNLLDESTSANIANDAYPYSTNNRLDNTTVPAAELYNANSDGSKLMNISVSKIAKASDGSVSFRFYPAGTDPAHGNKPDGALFYESFDYCEGTGGNDGVFGGTGAGSAQFYPDNSGWECSTAHGAAACAMFGSNTQTGNVLLPTFTIDGETVLTFRAAPITAKVPGVLSLSCETDGITLSDTEITIAQDEGTDAAVTLDGKGEVSLRMKETVGLNRFFLDEVAAVPAELSAIEAVKNDAENSRRQGVYTLSGVSLGSETGNLAKGVYIVNGKKHVVK